MASKRNLPHLKMPPPVTYSMNPSHHMTEASEGPIRNLMLDCGFGVQSLDDGTMLVIGTGNTRARITFEEGSDER